MKKPLLASNPTNCPHPGTREKSSSLKISPKSWLLILAFLLTANAFAATITTTGSGNWNSTTPNAPWPGGMMPSTGDDIIIGDGYTLTVNTNQTCKTINFTAANNGTGTGTLTVTAGVLLTVTSSVATTFGSVAIKGNGIYNLTGAGQINCASLICNTDIAPSGTSSSIIKLISTIANLKVSGDIIINSTFSSSGSKTNNGFLHLQSGIIDVNGSIKTKNANAVNISTLDMVTSANSPVLLVAGGTPFSLDGTGLSAINLNGIDATVNYDGSSQNAYSTSYTNLIFSGTGNKTIAAAPISVSGNLTVMNLGTVTANGALTVGGNVLINSGSTLSAGNSTHNIQGNWINNGTFTATNSTIHFNSSTQQDVSGTSVTSFKNATINNSKGVTLSTSAVVTGILAFSNGKIITGNNKLTLSTTATTSGAGAGKYIVGNEEIFIPNSTAPLRTFDIGDNSTYAPVTVAFSGSTTGTGSITAFTQDGDHTDIINSGILSLLSVNRTWTLNNSQVAGFTSYSATFNYVAGDKDLFSSTSNYAVRLYNGSTWMNTNVSSANSLSTATSGITTFGTYQIGNPGLAPLVATNPLPQSVCSINNASFTATASSMSAQSIKWQRDPNTGTFTDILAATDGNVYSNFNTATLTISNPTGLSNYKYRVIFTNPNGSTTSASATLLVSAASAATIAYASPSLCATGSASVTLTGSLGGIFSSAAGLKIDGTTGLIDLANSAPGDYNIAYLLPAIGVCPVIQKNTNLTIEPIGTWTGNISSEWNNPGNWQCNIVPIATTDVTVPSGLFNYPVVSGSVNGFANNLTLQAGTTITINNGVLHIAGTANTLGGKITSTNGKIDFQGNAAQVIPANLFSSNVVKDLGISNTTSVTLAGALRITNSVSFGLVNNSSLNSNGFLTLVSTKSNTAFVSDITNGGLTNGNSINGNVTVERYMVGRRAYRFLTAPVNSIASVKAHWMENTNNATTSVNNNPAPGYGTHITGVGGNTNGFDASGTNNASLFTFNNATQAWTAAPNTAGVFSAGSGFRIMVRGSRSVDLNNNSAASSITTLRATGTLTNGPVVFAANGGTPGTPALSKVVGAYSFLANPYASPVDWGSVIAASSDISPTLYIFDPTISGSYGRGGYVSYNGVLKVKNILSSLITKDVQSGQAFFVQTTGLNPTITFNENQKSDGFLPVFRSANDGPHVAINLMLPNQVGTTESADGTAVYFGENYSPAIGAEDSYKFNNQDENIAVVRDGISLSLEGRKPVRGTDTITLKIWQLTAKSYTLKIDKENFASNIEAYLQDKFLNTSTVLNSGENLVTFSVTSNPASSVTNRFNIVFETLSTLPVHLTGIKAFAKNKGVQVDWVAESESNIDIYEVERSVDGKNFDIIGSVKAKNNPGVAQPYGFFDIKPSSGDNFYRIKTFEKSGDSKLSEVLRVQIAGEKNTISVASNPIIGKTIRLLFDNVTKGRYSVAIISALGEKVFSSQINYAGGTTFEQINLPGYLPAGMYQIQVSGNSLNKTIQVLMQ